MSFTEDNYEKAVISLFEQMGYTHLYGPDIERDYYVPFYEEQLMDSLLLVNRGKPQTAIQEAIAKLKDIDTGSLTQKNEQFMDYLQHGIEVSYFDGKEQRNDIVYLVDYDQAERNDFKIVNQWTFVEHSEKRADIILFINGLPLVVMELKSPSREETDASEAYLQLRNYMQEIPSLFVYNVFCVMSDMACSKAGTITSKEDRYMEWKPKTATTKVQTLPITTPSLKESFKKNDCWILSRILSVSRKTKLDQPKYWLDIISILL